MHKIIARISLCCLAILAAAALGAAAASAHEIGQKVAVIQEDTPVHAGSLSINTLEAGEVLTVLNVREGWLLVSRGHAGWVDSHAVASPAEAGEVLNATAAQHPTEARARAARARFWLATEHIDEAIAESSEAIRLAPDLASAWVIRSGAQRVKKDYAAALLDAQSATRLAPQSPWGYIAAGDVWRDQRQNEHATMDYTTAVELDKKNCEAHLRLAKARLGSLTPTQWTQAAEDFSKTIRLAEFAPECRRAARIGRATAWDKDGRYTSALEEFSDLVAENKKDVEALAGRGLVYGNLFRYEKAIPDLDEAIALEPNNAHLYVVRGTIRTKQYNFRGAAKDLDEALKLDPNNAEVHLARGQMLARQKKWPQAIAAFTQAIDFDPGNATAYLARSEAYQSKGDAELAKADRAQVGRLNPYLLAPPSGKDTREQERQKMMKEFNSTAAQSG